MENERPDALTSSMLYKAYNKGIKRSIDRLSNDLYSLNDERDLNIKSIDPTPTLYAIITRKLFSDAGITNMEEASKALKLCIESLKDLLSIRCYEECYHVDGNPEWDLLNDLE